MRLVKTKFNREIKHKSRYPHTCYGRQILIMRFNQPKKLKTHFFPVFRLVLFWAVCYIAFVVDFVVVICQHFYPILF